MTTEMMGPSAQQTRHGRCACCGAALKMVKGDRRFTLLDAMILVAASAVAFVLVRGVLGDFYARNMPAWSRYLSVMIAGLVTWTPTALFLKLRSPRPTLRRLSKQPDFVAMLAATSILVLGLLSAAILALVRLARQGSLAKQGQSQMRLVRPPDPYWWVQVVILFGGVIGAAVIASWVVLIVSGRHRASWGWLDLIGRTIGVLWIVVFVINCCARLGSLRD